MTEQLILLIYKKYNFMATQYTPSGLSLSAAEQLSRQQQDTIQANKSKLKEGQLFLINIGEGGGQLAQYSNGKLNSLNWSVGQEGWKGRTIGQVQNQISDKAISELGINRNDIIDLRDDSNYLWRDVIQDLPRQEINDLNTFKSSYIAPSKPQELNELPDLTQEQRDEMQKNLNTVSPTGQVSGMFEKRELGLTPIQDTDIPFKEGLNETQKTSIRDLLSKPTSQWNNTDKANWEYATNNSPIPTGGQLNIQDTDIIESQNPLNDLINQLIKSDPFLSEQLSDPETKRQFDSLSPDLQGAYLDVLGKLGERIEAGEVINSDIEITPELAKEFLDQAKTEIDPYYQEQINLVKNDLETSFSRLQQDFEQGIRRAEEPFKQQLKAQSEIEAQAGLTFGSERQRRERETVEGQQQAISDVQKNLLRSIEDTATQAERSIGSESLRGISIPGIQDINVSTSGFSPSGTRTLFTPQGDLIGSLPKQREVDLRTRQSQLEESERKKRILNTTNL